MNKNKIFRKYRKKVYYLSGTTDILDETTYNHNNNKNKYLRK